MKGAEPEKPLSSETEAETEDATEDDTEDVTEEESTAEESEPETTTTPSRPPPPQFKLSTFVLTFLFVLGLWMLFDSGARNGIANGLGNSKNPVLLYTVIGFSSHYLLLTMFLAGALEMLATAIAYNWTTDWVKAAKVQSWGAAFRKVQMKAMRSGKKDQAEALKVHQQKLTKLSSEVSIAQLKGMAVTWFLLIVIYTWVGLLIGSAPQIDQVVNLGGAQVNLAHQIGGLPIPYWFVIFSLYTVPLSIVFRRVLKHYSLRKYTSGMASPVT